MSSKANWFEKFYITGKKAKRYNRELNSQPLGNHTYISTLISALLAAELHRHMYMAVLSRYDTWARHGGLKKENVWCRVGGHEGHLLVRECHANVTVTSLAVSHVKYGKFAQWGCGFSLLISALALARDSIFTFLRLHQIRGARDHLRSLSWCTNLSLWPQMLRAGGPTGNSVTLDIYKLVWDPDWGHEKMMVGCWIVSLDSSGFVPKEPLDIPWSGS
jgi:hypothetical protein